MQWSRDISKKPADWAEEQFWPYRYLSAFLYIPRSVKHSEYSHEIGLDPVHDDVRQRQRDKFARVFRSPNATPMRKPLERTGSAVQGPYR